MPRNVSPILATHYDKSLGTRQGAELPLEEKSLEISFLEWFRGLRTCSSLVLWPNDDVCADVPRDQLSGRCGRDRVCANRTFVIHRSM